MVNLVREWFGWPQQSRVSVTTAEKLSGEDLGPLALAFAVEAGLSLLFLFRRGTLPNHPGLSELRKLEIWSKLHHVEPNPNNHAPLQP
jgi:hypothetical protein